MEPAGGTTLASSTAAFSTFGWRNELTSTADTWLPPRVIEELIGGRLLRLIIPIVAVKYISVTTLASVVTTVASVVSTALVIVPVIVTVVISSAIVVPTVPIATIPVVSVVSHRGKLF